MIDEKEDGDVQTQIIIDQRYSIWEDFLEENPDINPTEKEAKWKDFVLECKEIANNKLQSDEEFFEIDYDGIRANYDKSHFEEQEIKNLSKQAIEEKRQSLKFDLISHLTSFSFLNELPLEIMSHSFLSLFLKHIPIRLNNKRIATKLHFVWLQDSGSGKGEAFRELGRIIEQYNKHYSAKYKAKFLDGSETVESFYNTFEHTKKGGYDLQKPVVGTFQEADALIIEECSYVFVEKRGQKQTKAEILLKALEDQPMLKRLASWNGKETTTAPNFVLFGSTRPIPDIQETIATSGLLQRTISCFRNIDAKTRQEMNLKNIYKKVKTDTSEEDYAGRRDHLCRRINELRQFTENNQNFSFEEIEDGFQLISKVINDMEVDLYNTITRLEHQKIAEAFISRFTDKILVLSIQNAILRESNKVSLTDVQSACDLMKKSYQQLCLWIEQSIDENRLLRRRRKMFTEYVRQWFILRPKYEKEEFIHLIAEVTKYSKDYARYLLDVFSTGNNSLLKIESGYVLVNKTGERKNG